MLLEHFQECTSYLEFADGSIHGGILSPEMIIKKRQTAMVRRLFSNPNDYMVLAAAFFAL